MTRRHVAALTAVLLASPCTVPLIAQERVDAAGVAVSARVTPHEGSALASGSLAHIELTVNDSRSGRPFAGARPRAWLSARRSELVSTETTCRDKVRGFIGGELAVRADVDLNASFFVTLNDDGTVAFVNPLIAWNRTKLEAIVQLPSVGLDWGLSASGQHLFVTMPAAHAVAVIDTDTRRLQRVIDLPGEGQPTRILVSSVDGTVWVGQDGAAVVHVIDGATGVPTVTEVPVGRGRHVLASDRDGHHVAVSNTADDTVTIIAAGGRSPVATLAVPGTPLDIVWAAQRRVFYVATLNGGTVVPMAAGPWRTLAPIALSPGLVDLGMETTGRYLVAVNQRRSRVDVIDSVTDRIRASAAVGAQPDQVTFTSRFAYVRALDAETFSLLDLTALDAPSSDEPLTLTTTPIQAGQQRPSSQPERIGVAPMIVPLPDGKGALIASAPERRLFYFLEGGMLAPTGTFDNARRTPRALLVLDRGLRDLGDGRFETTVSLPTAGEYDLAVLVDQPQVTHCFTVQVGRGAASTGAPALATLEILPQPVAVPASVERDVTVAFRVVDEEGAPVAGLDRARAIVFRPPGGWQTSLWLAETGPGLYRAQVRLPEPGHYTAAFDAGTAARLRGRRVLEIEVLPTEKK